MTDPHSLGALAGDARAQTPSSGRGASYDAALRYLYERINYERMVSGSASYPFRLQRMRELLGRLGLGDCLYDAGRNPTPAPKVPLFHIAGTKGKGSTATMVAAACSAAGLKTGLYTSPHLHELEERFQIDGRCCEPQQLVELVDRIRPVTEALAAESIGSPSFFELTTAIALLHFYLSDVDAMVMEVGLGGRLDSTNVCASTVTAITSIGLDHQHVLGHTHEKIAAEKAGIIKPGVPVISGVRHGTSAAVIQATADQHQATCYAVDRDFDYHWQPATDWGSQVRIVGHTGPLRGELQFDLAMEGEHQARNAAVATAMVQVARTRGVAVDDAAITRGIGPLRCAGRTERYQLPDGVLGIVDAAHNEDSVTALCDAVGQRAAGRRIAVVFGTSLDKSAEPMLQLLGELADRIWLTRFQGNPRFRDPQQLLPLVPSPLRPSTTVIDHPLQACQRALADVTPGGIVVVCGSFFLAAETRGWMAAQANAGLAH